MSNVIDLADQAMFLAERSPLANLLQCVWVYNHTIDIDGLQHFHRHLQRGRLSRRVERSPLPFGRHRCNVNDVSPPGDRLNGSDRPIESRAGQQAGRQWIQHGPG